MIALRYYVTDDDFEDQLVEVLAEEDEANALDYAGQFQR